MLQEKDLAEELIARVRAYDPVVEEGVLSRAFVYAKTAHATQQRANGEPYFLHPVAVANILAGLRLDSASIITALLHDTVEDTAVTLEDIEKQFGKEISKLVDGVTKLTRLELQSERSKQSENFRKLVLAMSEDIRVLLVKLADRLHNMRTLHYIEDPAKRRRIARETMDIYVPLAERIGIQSVKDELQDLAFSALYPDAYQSIVNRLQYLKAQNPNLVSDIVGELTNILAKQGLDAVITGREKSPYSIWRKMQRANVTFEQLSDIMAFRVLVPDLAGCYQALGILHSTYPLIPGRFKDYISTPKSNDYRSLHTGLIRRFNSGLRCRFAPRKCTKSPKRGWRRIGNTNRAHRPMAANTAGCASCWKFWRRPRLRSFWNIPAWKCFRSRCSALPPRATSFRCLKGSTPVDFAYNIHSDIGDRCTGARVNGRLVQLRTVLNNGDQVEIITSRSSTPSPSWEEFVVTGRAKACVRRFIRMQQRSQYAELGKTMLTEDVSRPQPDPDR
jgi:GTP pyrophosphokinase